VIGGRVDPEHVIGRHKVLVAKLFGGLGVVAQHRGTGADVTHWYRGAELHGETPLA